MRFDNKLGGQSTRRGFIKSTMVAGLAIAGGAVAAKKVVDAVLREDTRRLYMADALGVEHVWKGKKLHLMSKGEKKEMVSALIKSFESGGK